MSHGSLVSGYLPVSLAFPSMVAVLLGPMVDVPSQLLVQAYTESLYALEAATIKQDSETPIFSNELQNKLITILGGFGLRMCRSSSSQLKAKLLDVAKYHFLVNPWLL